jgi:hypothetical protein
MLGTKFQFSNFKGVRRKLKAVRMLITANLGHKKSMRSLARFKTQLDITNPSQ